MNRTRQQQSPISLPLSGATPGLPYGRRGFTLLEVLIAVAIFAVVSVMAYGGLSSVLKVSQKTRDANKALQTLQMAISLVNQDMTQIANRPIRDEFGQVQPALKSGSAYEEIIVFTRRGWRNPAETRRSTLQRVAYRLDENTLVREYWRELDRGPNPKKVALPLLDHVKKLSFRYMDKRNAWQQAWPPLTAEPGKPVGLPKAIEMNLDTERWGVVTRLFALE